jgi:adenylate cyclase
MIPIKEDSTTQITAKLDSTENEKQIKEELQRVLASPSFRATKAQRAFLRFVVEKMLAGESDEIKGYTIATQVFGRGEDFDQSIDPIVSIQANKLRRALEHHYLLDGLEDPIRIDIPKGTYVPRFLPQSDLKGIPGDQPAKTDVWESIWPTVLIKPFDNLTGDPEMNYLATGLAIELGMEISRYQEIRLMIQDLAGGGRRASDSGTRFIIDGSIRQDSAGAKLTVNLNDAHTGMRIWGDMYRSEHDAIRMMDFQEQIAREISAKIIGESGIISKTLVDESRYLHPKKLKTYQAILSYHDFNTEFSYKSFMRAFEALECATTKQPECGLSWSMLARLYVVNHSLELFPQETPLDTACVFAEKGVQLEPANQRARMILSYAKMISGDIDSALAEAEQALTHNMNSLIMLENIGYLMALCGDWSRGPALIRKAIRLNPYYNVVVHHVLFLDFLRQQDYEQAYLETLKFRTPSLFWDPLLKISVLGLQGRIDEGRQSAEKLLKLKPDFSESGRRLIKNYLKFDEIFDPVAAGLQSCGLEI